MRTNHKCAALAIAGAFVFSIAGALAPLAAGEGGDLDPIVELLIELLVDNDDDDELSLELLAGLEEGLSGRTDIAMPDAWPRAYVMLSKSKSREVRERALALALRFDDPQALEALRDTLADQQSPAESRRRALAALVEKRATGLAELLHKLLDDDDEALRAPILRALAAFDDDRTAAAILGVWSKLGGSEQADAVSTLVSRPAWAIALLDAVKRKEIPARAISAIHARQIRALGDGRAIELLRDVWGDVRATDEDKRKLIAETKAKLTPERLATGDSRRGRALFESTCAKCHRLFDGGGDIGPELTGSNRADLDYILENILDPSAMIGRDYQLYTAILRDGRVLSGLLRERAGGRL